MRKLYSGDFFMKHFFEGMICGLLNGFFGSGGGVAAVPIIEREQAANESGSDPTQTAHASSVALIFVLSVTATISYMFSGGLDYNTAWEYVPYGLAGAAAGSIFLRKIRAVWLKRLFGGLICAAAVRTLFT